MGARDYRVTIATGDCPFSLLDTNGDGSGTPRACGDWVAISGGTLGQSVTIDPFRPGDNQTFTVGSDGVTAWPVPLGIRSVVSMSGATSVEVGAGAIPVSFGVQGPKGDPGDKGDTGDTGPAGPDTYTPATPGDWAEPAPTTFSGAVDRLAALAKTLNSGTPVP